MTYGELPERGTMACAEALDDHGVYSAWKGDYFWAFPSAEITCGECGASMVLVQHVDYFEVVA